MSRGKRAVCSSTDTDVAPTLPHSPYTVANNPAHYHRLGPLWKHVAGRARCRVRGGSGHGGAGGRQHPYQLTSPGTLAMLICVKLLVCELEMLTMCDTVHLVQ